MSAGNYDLTVEVGATLDVTFTWYTDEDATLPKDLTGYSAAAQVRNTAGTAVLSMSTTASTITLGGGLGTIRLIVPAATTAALTAGVGLWDLELTTGTTVTRLLEGRAIITPNQTFS